MSAVVALGMLAGFLLLRNKPEHHMFQREPFRELRFPMRSQPRLAITQEHVISDPNGVVIEQGSQSIRVGPADITLYANSEQALSVTEQGNVIVGNTQTITPINSFDRNDLLTVNGNIVLTGSKVLETTPSSVSALFYDQEQGHYYDYGGIKIIDRSYIPNSTSYLLGEWIQLQISSPTMLKALSLYVATSNQQREVSVPNIFHLLGSTNGSTWYLITSKLNQSASFQDNYITYSITNTKPYSYYRLVFTELTKNSVIGPFLQLYGLLFTDVSNNQLPPQPMNTNQQTFDSGTYTFSCSKGGFTSFINGDIQSKTSNLAGLTQNRLGGSLNKNSYTLLAFPFNNDYYSPGDLWMASGLSSTLTINYTTPFNSAVGLYASYHGSHPMECMRVVHNGGSGMVGIGVTNPRSNLSVLGSFDTSYLSADVLGTRLAINNTSSNYIHLTSGISSGAGFSQILFHSSDGQGTGTTNYYDTSIISYGGEESQNNRGLLALTGKTISIGSALYTNQNNVGVGTSTPDYPFQVNTTDFVPGLTHCSGKVQLQSVIGKGIAQFGTTTTHCLSLMTGGVEGIKIDEARNVSVKENICVGGDLPLARLHVIGNQFIQGSNLFIGDDMLNSCLRLFKSNLGCHLDYQQNLFIRSNRSVDLNAADYYTSLSINSTGNVGIGTSNAGQETTGGYRCYGLDIYGSASREVGLLRLVNTFPDNILSKGTAIQFVNTYGEGPILQAEIVGRSDNTHGSRGTIDFWIKSASTNVDGNDLQITGSVDRYGVISGSTNYSRAFHTTTMNALGQLWCGVAGDQGDYSLMASSGDAVIRTAQTSRNLLIQSGAEFPAIFVQNLDIASRVRQSRVGIGSTAPQGLLTVSRLPQNILATDVIDDGAVDRYALYVDSGLITSQQSNVSAPSIYLASGGVSYEGNVAKGARIEVTGGMNRNGGVVHGAVNMYTELGGESDPIVTIGNASASLAGSMTYFGYNSSYMTTTAMNLNSYAIYAKGNVVTSNTFIAMSDQRLKKDIIPLDNSMALNLVNRIKIYEYQMRDYLREPGRQIGVIAQQLREVIPEAVKEGDAQYVADQLAFIQAVKNDQTECMIHLYDGIDLVEGQRVRLVNDRRENRDVVIVKKLTNKIYSINEQLNTERSWMVYGTLQEGILAVDKPMLGMLALSAIQELSSEIREMKDMIRQINDESLNQSKRLDEVIAIVGKLLT